jgi:outer membrane protein with beta-barrel domain
MKRILCLTLFVLVALGAPAFAANNKTNKSSDTGGEIGFGVGQSDVSSADSSGINTAQFLGVRGGYHLNEQWQVEGQFASSSENGDIAGTSVDTTMRLYMVNGVMNFHPRKKEFVPYVMAGIGRADVSVDVSGTSASDNSVAYQIGGGTRIFFGKSKTMAFRADLSLLRDTAFQDSSTLTTVTAGLTWKLGGH